MLRDILFNPVSQVYLGAYIVVLLVCACSSDHPQILSMDENMHVEHRFQSPHMHRFTIRHYSVFKAIWDWIILALIIYTAIVTPYVTLFTDNSGKKVGLAVCF